MEIFKITFISLVSTSKGTYMPYRTSVLSLHMWVLGTKLRLSGLVECLNLLSPKYRDIKKYLWPNTMQQNTHSLPSQVTEPALKEIAAKSACNLTTPRLQKRQPTTVPGCREHAQWLLSCTQEEFCVLRTSERPEWSRGGRNATRCFSREMFVAKEVFGWTNYPLKYTGLQQLPCDQAHMH